MSGPYPRPVVVFDDHMGVTEIAGVKYSYEFFGELGMTGAPAGTVLQVLKRDDGVLTVRRIEQGE